jgi:hypothetical protein
MLAGALTGESHSVGGKLLFSIYSMDFINSVAICRHNSGRCHSFLPLTYFLSFHLSKFSFNINIPIIIIIIINNIFSRRLKMTMKNDKSNVAFSRQCGLHQL